jgi:hypothetical protein
MGNCIRSEVTRNKNGTKVQFELPADAGSDQATWKLVGTFSDLYETMLNNNSKSAGKNCAYGCSHFLGYFSFLPQSHRSPKAEQKSEADD